MNQIERQELKLYVKKLQHACVLKYSINKQQCDSLKYYNFHEIKKREEETYQSDDELQDSHVYSSKTKTKSQNEKHEYIRLTYFLDQNGQVQIIYLNKLGSINENYEEIRKTHYQSHVKAKIGLPEKNEFQDQNVIVEYQQDLDQYSDAKYVGSGLIENFVKPDPIFESRNEQNKCSNYLVAQTLSDQYLVVYCRSGFGNRLKGKSLDFKIQITKIKHLLNEKIQNSRITQIDKFLQRNCDFSQLRINLNKEGLLSSSTGIDYEKSGQKIELNEQIYPEEKIDKTQLVEKINSNTSIILETIQPLGKFIIIPIVDQNLPKIMQTRHKKFNAKIRTKFYFSPKSYFIHSNVYHVVLELRVRLKGVQQYYFTAENILVKMPNWEFQSKFQKKEMTNQCLIDNDTLVQFFILPKEPVDSSDEFHKESSQQMKYQLSEPQPLSEYNLFQTRFFKKKHIEIQFQEQSSEDIFRFEKFIDSTSQNDFIPFISFKKKIDKLDNYNKNYPNRFNKFLFQAMYFSGDSLSVTPCKYIDPHHTDRRTIQSENQIQLFRTSDYFKNSSNQTVVHYQFAINLDQQIHRVSILELMFRFCPSKGKIKIVPVARIEKLNSNISKLTNQENVNIIREKIENSYDSKEKQELQQIMNKYQRNDDQILVEAANNFFDVKKGDQALNENDLVPFTQSYQTAYATFGYKKKEKKHQMGFDLTIYSRINSDAVRNNIFNKFEIYTLHQQFIQSLLHIRPIMFKDFDFLLSFCHKSYNFQKQRDENFFQQQELYYGRSMCDLHLNDVKQIHKAIKKSIRDLEQLEQIKTYGKRNHEENINKAIQGSVFDMVLQNSPYKDYIIKHSQLGIQAHSIISQDFNLKSQLVRSLEQGVDNAFVILMDAINDLNHDSYRPILMMELYRMLDQENIKDLYSFFQVDKNEEILEQIGEQNSFCNFVQSINDNKAPPMWNDPDGMQFCMQKFRDSRNQEEEIVNRIINIFNGQEQSTKRIEVKHKYIDFQYVQLGEKIRRLNDFIDNQFDDDDEISEHEIKNGDLTNFSYNLDDLDIAQMMIQSEVNSEFYELEAIQKIIDLQFLRARKFFTRLFMFYLLGFAMPCIIAYVVDSQLITNICCSISLFTLICFLGIELCQLKKLGAEEYFCDFWNIVDFSQTLVFSATVIVNFVSEPEELIILKMILNLSSLFQTFAKSLSFVRLSDDFGFLVKMIGITINELLPFMIFFMLYTTFFSTAFMITQIDTERYERLNKDFAYFLLGFRNSIGDFHQPMYQGWITREEKGEITLEEEHIIVFLIWFVWILQAMFMVIILLNYLIAVISQAYERVVNQRYIYSYIHKSQINYDYFMIINQIFGGLGQPKILVFVDSCQYLIDKNQHWLGFLNQFKKQVQKIEDIIVGKIQNLHTEVIETSHKSISKEQSLTETSRMNRVDLKVMKNNMAKLEQKIDDNYVSMQEQFDEMKVQNERLNKNIAKLLKGLENNS